MAEKHLTSRKLPLTGWWKPNNGQAELDLWSTIPGSWHLRRGSSRHAGLDRHRCGRGDQAGPDAGASWSHSQDLNTKKFPNCSFIFLLSWIPSDKSTFLRLASHCIDGPQHVSHRHCAPHGWWELQMLLSKTGDLYPAHLFFPGDLDLCVLWLHLCDYHNSSAHCNTLG